MATGDLKGCLRKLQASLRALKYPKDVDYQRLAKGDPFSCLPIVSYAFTSFSPPLAELLVESGIELTGKNDLSFIESVYKVLRDLFSYKPLLNKQQFLQFGFAERKIGLLCDIIGLVLNKHNQLTKSIKPLRHSKRRLLYRSDCKTSESPPSPDTRKIPAQRSLSRSDCKTSESPTSPDTYRIPAQRSLSCSDSKTSESPTSPDTYRIPAQRSLSRSDSKTSESPTSPDTYRIPAQRSLSRSDSKTSESPPSPDTRRNPAQRSLPRSDTKISENPTSPDTHRIPAQRSLSCSDSKTSESPPSPDTHRIPAQRSLSRSDSKTSGPASSDTHKISGVLSRPLVARHVGSSSPAKVSFSSDVLLQEKRDEDEGGEPSRGRDSPRPAAHTGCVSECALRAVERGLRECMSRMVQLDARLQAVERSATVKVGIERSQWDNLESRVLLLETSLALATARDPVKAGGAVSLPDSGEKSHLTEETVERSGSSPEVEQTASEASSTTQPPAGLPSTSPEETIKERLERITNMMKDTSSLLKTSF